MKPLWLVYSNRGFGEDSVGVIFKNGDGKSWNFHIILERRVFQCDSSQEATASAHKVNSASPRIPSFLPEKSFYSLFRYLISFPILPYEIQILNLLIKSLQRWGYLSVYSCILFQWQQLWYHCQGSCLDWADDPDFIRKCLWSNCTSQRQSWLINSMATSKPSNWLALGSWRFNISVPESFKGFAINNLLYVLATS